LSNRAFRYRIYPNRAQEEELRTWQRSCRFLWNVANEQRLAARAQWKFHRAIKPPTAFGQMKQLTDAIHSGEFMPIAPRDTYDKVIDALDMAWARFFKQKDLGVSAPPRFKGRDCPIRIRLRGARLTRKTHRIGSLVLAKKFASGAIKCVMDRDMSGTPAFADLVEENGDWYVSFMCKDVSVPSCGRGAVGIDRGVTDVVADSNGRCVAAPEFIERGIERIRRAGKRLSAAKKGSKNRQRRLAEFREAHRRLAAQRQDFNHKLSTRYARENETVVIEGLAVQRMTKSAKGTIDEPGVNVAAKAGLNREILARGWSQFESMLKCKLEDGGGSLIKVSPAYTSQTCSACGAVDADSRDGKLFKCTTCGFEGDADVNAAKNILAKGISGEARKQKSTVALGGFKRWNETRRKRGGRSRDDSSGHLSSGAKSEAG
jgi:putative transposase